MSGPRRGAVPGVAGPFLLPSLVLLWALVATWGSDLVVAKVVLVGVVAALLTRPWPLTGLVAGFVGLFAGADLPDGSAEDQHLALLVLACYRVGLLAPLRRQPWAATAVLLLLSSSVIASGADLVAADAVFPVVLTAGPWLLGLSVRLASGRERDALRLADELERAHAGQLERATSEERLRIAQEFHDVVAHDLTGLSLQAQLLRRRAEAGEAIGPDELREVERSAQRSMADLRHVLGVLRPREGDAPVEPAPGIGDVPDLVERARRLGQQVEVTTLGRPRTLPPLLSSAVYRMLQECLTNARRHGGSGRTEVIVDWRPDSVHVKVTNPLRRDHRPAGGDPGHGLVGMRERAAVFGGRLRAGSQSGSWCTDVSLPTPAAVEGTR